MRALLPTLVIIRFGSATGAGHEFDRHLVLFHVLFMKCMVWCVSVALVVQCACFSQRSGALPFTVCVTNCCFLHNVMTSAVVCV